MKRFNRWPVAVMSLGLGVVGGFVANDRLVGQAPPLMPAPVAVMPRELTSFAPVVKRVVPAVVSLESKSKAQPIAVPGNGRRTQFTPAAAPPTDQGPSVDPGFGSGVLIDPSGVVLTNNHVVEDTDSVDITLSDGRKFTSKDIRRDPKTDLAVVRFQADGGPLPFLEFGDSDALEVGDRVLAVGAPFGLTGSVTHGIISAKSRNNLRLNQYEDFLQTDAAINPGNSGGPLVNLEGRVIGLTSAIKTRSGGFQGVGLAVSSNLARNVAQQLLKDGVVRRGYLGVEIRDVPTGGTSVIKVAETGPAMKAKVLVGDVITAVAGKPVKESRDLQRIVAGLPLGQPTEVTVSRAGQPQVLSVVVEEQPGREQANKIVIAPGGVPAPAGNANAPAAAAQFPDLGLVLADLTPQVSAQLRFPEGALGVAILRIEPKSVAAQAGLVRGALVVKVDKTSVSNVKEFRQAIANADRTKGALVQSVRPNGETDFAILKVQ